MAYSAPELLLVGAAQNLVLCSLVKDEPPCIGEQEEGSPEYDSFGLW